MATTVTRSLSSSALLATASAGRVTRGVTRGVTTVVTGLVVTRVVVTVDGTAGKGRLTAAEVRPKVKVRIESVWKII